MRSLEELSENYVKSFKTYLWLYPKSYRVDYGEAMSQLLRDQLTEAERLGDRHVLREIYLHALAGLPASIAKEYWSSGRGSVSLQLGVTPGLGWQLVLLPLAIIYVWSVFAGYTPREQALGAICGLSFLLLQSLFVFLATRRLLVALSIFIFAAVGWWLASFISAASYHYYADPSSKYYLISEILHALVPLLLIFVPTLVFYRLRKRLRRPDLAEMTGEELATYRAKLERKRHRRSIMAGAVLALIIAANLAGLYDPAQDDSDLALPVVTVSKADNMYSDLKSLDQPGLTDDQKVAIFLQASQKRAFQEPAFADLNQFSTLQSAANAPMLNYNPIGETARLIVNQADGLRQTGRAALALTDIMAVIKISDAISASQGPIITNMVGRSNELNALDYLLSWQKSGGFNPAEQSILDTTFDNLHPQSEGIVKSLKAEYWVEALSVSSLRSPDVYQTSGYVFGSYLVSRAAYLPYFYQPNRTKAIFTNRFRALINEAQLSCSQQSVRYPTYDRLPLKAVVELLRFNGLGHFMGDTAWIGNYWQPQSCQIESLINQLKSVAE